MTRVGCASPLRPTLMNQSSPARSCLAAMPSQHPPLQRGRHACVCPITLHLPLTARLILSRIPTACGSRSCSHPRSAGPLLALAMHMLGSTPACSPELPWDGVGSGGGEKRRSRGPPKKRGHACATGQRRGIQSSTLETMILNTSGTETEAPIPLQPPPMPPYCPWTRNGISMPSVMCTSAGPACRFPIWMCGCDAYDPSAMTPPVLREIGRRSPP